MKKAIILLRLALVVCVLVLLYCIIKFSPEYMYRVIRYGESDVNDHLIFPERAIQKSEKPYIYDRAVVEGFGDRDLSYVYRGEIQREKLQVFLKNTHTTALIVLKDDKILYEHYDNGCSKDAFVTSFSSVKSIDSLLIGQAIEQGYINSVKDPAEKYIKELKGSPIGAITIEQLLTMRSPIKYKEGGLWFGDDAKTYYMPDLRKLVVKDTVIDPVYNGRFHYNNYHPLLLGVILERSTGQTVAGFLEKNLWQKLGTEYDASWSLDSEKSGFEKMESGLNFRAIDYAKIGSMMLHQGYWNGQQIVSKEWIDQSTVAQFPLNAQEYKGSFLENRNTGYRYMWYSTENGKGHYDFYAAGKYGQFIYISPSNNVVVVRTGIDGGAVDWWPDILKEICQRAAE